MLICFYKIPTRKKTHNPIRTQPSRSHLMLWWNTPRSMKSLTCGRLNGVNPCSGKWGCSVTHNASIKNRLSCSLQSMRRNSIHLLDSFVYRCRPGATGLNYPGLRLGAPSKIFSRLWDFPMKVPFAKWKWPCPLKDEIPELLKDKNTFRNVCWKGSLICFCFVATHVLKVMEFQKTEYREKALFVINVTWKYIVYSRWMHTRV